MIEAGFSVHVLKRGSKAPESDEWQVANVHTVESFAKAYHDGANVGLRLGEPSKTSLGYCHLIDVDIRDPEVAEEAYAALHKIWPGYETAPTVMSGSGGDSSHRYLFTPEHFRSRKLLKSDEFRMVFDPKLDREVKKHRWELDLFGTGK